MKKRILTLALAIALCLGLATPILAAESDYEPITISISLPGLPDTILALENVYPYFDYARSVDSAPWYGFSLLESGSSVSCNKPFSVSYLSAEFKTDPSTGIWGPTSATDKYAAGDKIVFDFGKTYGGTFTISLPPENSESDSAISGGWGAASLDEVFSKDTAAEAGAVYGASLGFGYYSGSNPEELSYNVTGGDIDGNEFKESKPHISVISADNAEATAPPTTSAQPVAAKPTASPVLVNGKNVAFDAYNIANNNYFKLRDLAFILSGTEKQFEVGYDDATKAITLTSGKSYTAVGGEMASKGAGSKSASPTSSKIYLDGAEVAFTAYNIGGNNYFKLRDIGQAFDFGVEWDSARNTIVIDTSTGYTPE